MHDFFETGQNIKQIKFISITFTQSFEPSLIDCVPLDFLNNLVDKVLMHQGCLDSAKLLRDLPFRFRCDQIELIKTSCLLLPMSAICKRVSSLHTPMRASCHAALIGRPSHIKCAWVECGWLIIQCMQWRARAAAIDCGAAWVCVAGDRCRVMVRTPLW